MKQFLIKILVVLLVFFAGIELFSRILIDPFYYYTINTYNEKKTHSLKNIFSNDTEQVDYLFVGTSRIPATINPELIHSLSEGKTAINAGRGYMTAGIHHQAIKNKLKNHSDYLEGAYVFVEYAGSDIYASSFEEERLRVYETDDPDDKAMPHLLLPYLSPSSFFSFLRESDNSPRVKRELSFLYAFSTLRTSRFINEKFHRLDAPLNLVNDKNLVIDGGIRDDNIESAKQLAFDLASQTKERIMKEPVLDKKDLENSSLAAMNELITQNGGTLVLFKMPLHSVQTDIYSTSRARENKKVFEEWLQENDIRVVQNTLFTYQDSDFPDTWHLAKDRRDEFTALLYEEIKARRLCVY